jgi:glycolate oxidase iron-sulfur subunit
MDAMFEKTNRLGMELLQAAGCEVVSLTGETCCGALHAHAGELELAKQMAKRNIIALELMEKQGHIDYVVHTAGGCGAMLIEYDHLLREEEEWVEQARHFSSKSKDIAEVLIQANPLPFRQMNDMNKIGKNNHSSYDKGSAKDTVSIIGDSQPQQMVTYQRSCHMTHVQKSVIPPLQLLQSVPGTQLQEMPDKDKCCGSVWQKPVESNKYPYSCLDIVSNRMSSNDALLQIF